MVTIDEHTLLAHGIELPAEDAEAFMAALKARVEEEVGLALLAKLDDNKAKELLELTGNAGEQEINSWLDQNLPGYEHIVQQEVNEILDEVAAAQGE